MKTPHSNNENLLKKIYDRIKWDIRVNSSDLQIRTDGGHVILSGYFDKSYRHAAAVEIIKSTSGVESLEDQSQVVSDYFRTDAELKKLIKNQIKSLHLLPREWINVAVLDGIVKLEGVVFRPRMKAFVASDTWGHSGVQDCMNLIEVRSPQSSAEAHQGLSHATPDYLSREYVLMNAMAI